MIKRLWGDNYYNEATKKWDTQCDASDPKMTAEDCRGYNKYILSPIYEIFKKCMATDNKDEKLIKFAEKLNIKLTSDEKELFGKPLLKVSTIVARIFIYFPFYYTPPLSF